MNARPVTVRSDDLELLLSGELPDAGRVTEAWHRMYAALHEEDSGAAPVSARDALLSLAAEFFALMTAAANPYTAEAYGIAARMANIRADVSHTATEKAAPAPGDARQAAGRSVDLSALGHLTEDRLEALYREWLDSDAHLPERDHYGIERGAFYAGVAAGAGVPAHEKRGEADSP